MNKTIYNWRLTGFALILPLALLCASCSSAVQDPSESPDSDTTTLTLNIITPSAATNARTVTADFGNITKWKVELVRTNLADGSPQPADPALQPKTAPVQNFDTAKTGAQLKVTGMEPGTWIITVTSTTGTLVTGNTTAVLVLGDKKSLAVNVAPMQSSGSGSGNFSLKIGYPTATGVDYVGFIIDPDLPGPVEQEATYASVGVDNRLATIAATGIGSGTHILKIFFRYGYSTGTIAKTVIESVNIWDGMTSDKWISSGGTLLDRKTYALADFSRSGARLAALVFGSQDLYISGAQVSFAGGTNAYDLGPLYDDTVCFTATAGMDGQLIDYSTNEGATWLDIASGCRSNLIGVSGLANQKLYVRVTAPDQSTKNTYIITCRRVIKMRYDGNDGKPPISSTPYAGTSYSILPPQTPPVLDGINLKFTGWNTIRTGGGTSYQPGDTINPVTQDLTLYAQWTTIGGIGPGGGYVFYDKALDANPAISSAPYSDGWRYLEAKGSTGSSTAIWNSDNTNFVDGTQMAIGTGKQNTLRILAKTASTGGAIAATSNIDTGTCDDWFLPSTNELIKIFDNLINPHYNDFIPGVFDNSSHWTSSEDTNGTYAYFFDFDVNSGNSSPKSFSYYYTPVRAFSGPSPTRIVLYDANNADSGTVPVDTQFYPDGKTAVIKENTGNLVRTGCRFIGWNTKPDGSETLYKPGDQTAGLTDDLYLFAEWLGNYASFTASNISPFLVNMSLSPINNSDGSTIPNGTVIIYRTSSGYFGKLEMVSNNGAVSFMIRYITYNNNGSILKSGVNIIISSSFPYNLDNDAYDDLMNHGVTSTERYFEPENGAIFYRYE